MINSKHKIYITEIKPELDADVLRITIHMGVEAKSNIGMKRDFVPLIGKVELKFGTPTTKVVIDRVL